MEGDSVTGPGQFLDVPVPPDLLMELKAHYGEVVRMEHLVAYLLKDLIKRRELQKRINGMISGNVKSLAKEKLDTIPSGSTTAKGEANEPDQSKQVDVKEPTRN